MLIEYLLSTDARPAMVDISYVSGLHPGVSLIPHWNFPRSR